MGDVLGDLGLGGLVAVFLIGAAFVALAGSTLAKAGDRIADVTGLGGALVGMILLAGATSLPEIFGVVTAARADAADLAVGDLLGSSMANMAILAVIDVMSRRAVWPSVELGHARVGVAAILLTAIAVMGIVTADLPPILWVGAETFAIAVLYVAIVAWTRRTALASVPGAVPVDTGVPQPTGIGDETEPGREAWTLRQAGLRYGGAALVILVAAPAVALSAKGIADETGIGQGFVGAAAVALVTSLPELTASIAAVRIGAFDLAVGNLFGSNLFNMAMLLVADLAYTQGAILRAVDAETQAVTGIGAIILMATALGGLLSGAETRARRLEPDAALLLGMWIVILGLVYLVSM
jgi:cation:H+ antiporter